MKTIPVPVDQTARARKCRALMRNRKALNLGILLCSAIAVLCLIGVLVVVIMLEMRENSADTAHILYILLGAFAAGAAAFAFTAFFCGRGAQSARNTELDFRERCDGEESFFVGEGTLATFEEDGLRLHAEAGDKKPIFIPYRDLTLHSVCRRKKPRAAGEWLVVFALPSHYVIKERKGKDVPPVVKIEADGKERLYRAIEAHNLALQGEVPVLPMPKKQAKGAPFALRAKYLLPNPARRRRALITLCICAAAIVAGVVVAIVRRDLITIGALITAFGLLFLCRSAYAFVQAKGVIAFYEEGVYWKEGGRAIDEKIFLKWEEVEQVSVEEVQEKRYLRLRCAYGDYHLPDVAGAYEYIQQNRPALCA